MTDLEHNRHGTLSPAQADVVLALRRRAYPTAALGVLLLLWGYATPLFIVGFVVQARAWRFLPFALAGGALIAACVTLIHRRIRRDARPQVPGEPRVAPGPVVALDGASVWTPDRGLHPVRADGAPLLPGYTVLLLPPGPWRFYLHQGDIVGAESPRDPNAWWSITQGGVLRSSSAYHSGAPPAPLPVGDPAALLRAVSAALRFDADDLAHNRRGALSPRQGAGAVIAIEGMLESCVERSGTFAVNKWLTGDGRAIPTPPGGMTAASSHRAWWIVNGRTILVPLAAFWAVPPGLVWRVYLDAHTGRVLSAEPAPHAHAAPPA
jgi:hypothetical protein